jgi:hypothetical protein
LFQELRVNIVRSGSLMNGEAYNQRIVGFTRILYIIVLFGRIVFIGTFLASPGPQSTGMTRTFLRVLVITNPSIHLTHNTEGCCLPLLLLILLY